MKTLSKSKIADILNDVSRLLSENLEDDMLECRLYGSCARGDYSEESDIDILVLTRCNRIEMKKYNHILGCISADICIKYEEVVNFLCVPYEEYYKKRTWYGLFQNIERDGEIVWKKSS
jgi:predicted nucleotidyltransferase